MLDLQFSSQARKFLKNLDDLNWKRITNKIKDLREKPFPQEAKRIKGRKNKTFRIRVGDFRILYIVQENLLFISDIDKRGRVYK